MPARQTSPMQNISDVDAVYLCIQDEVVEVRHRQGGMVAKQVIILEIHLAGKEKKRKEKAHWAPVQWYTTVRPARFDPG